MLGDIRRRIEHGIGIVWSADDDWGRIGLEFLYVFTIIAAVDVSINGRLDILEPMGVSPSLDNGNLLVTIPSGVYLYALLGAGVYVATSLVFEPKDSVGEVKRLGYRLLAALPLGAGVFLFASVILGGDVITVPIEGESGEAVSLDANTSAAGLAFLGGLFIRLTLKKLGDIAETISNVGQVGGYPHRAMEERLAATEAVLGAWRIPADAEDRSQELDPDAYAKLRQAETLLESGDASVSQLERASELAEEARNGFGRAAERRTNAGG